MSTQIDNAKALSHPLRVRILETLAENEPSSPARLSIALDEPLGNVSYHFKTLLEYGMVECVATKPVRGALEHFYARTPAVLDSVTESQALNEIARFLREGHMLGDELVGQIRRVLLDAGRKVDAA